jgi:fatty acid desaturase
MTRGQYRRSGFGMYLVLYFFTGLIVLVVAYFLAALTLILLGFTIDVWSFPPSLHDHAGWMLIALWLFYVLIGHTIAYKVLWEGRAFG